MKKLRNMLLAFSILLFGFGQSFAQETQTVPFDTGSELSNVQLSEVYGDGPGTAVGAGIIVGGGTAIGCAITGCGSPGQTFVTIVIAAGGAAAGGFLSPLP